ncbi:hypothetical protein ACFL29_00535 [Patescibacteria group bacterium]
MQKETKITYWLFGLSIFFVIFHNLLSGLIKAEEAVSFLWAIAFIAAFIISVIYNTTLYITKGKPVDIYKLGFLGLLGLIGLIPQFGPGLFGFFGFFGFFGARGKTKK